MLMEQNKIDILMSKGEITMVKIEKKKVYKEVEVVVSEKYYCDKCDKEIFDSYEDVESNKIKFKRGERDCFSNYEDIVVEKAYFCKECADEIKILLQNIGVKFTKSRIEC